jgi:hypothetical protein
MITDPNGMDWFVDEETGDIQYNSSLGKDDAAQVGENYKWLGANDMFGYSEDEMRAAVYDKNGIIAPLADNVQTYTNTDIDNNSTVVDEAHFSGDNAKKFMNLMGYKDVSAQEFVYELSANEHIPVTPNHSNTITTGIIIQIREKTTYVPKSYEMIYENRVELALPKPYLTLGLEVGMESIYRRNPSYGISQGTPVFVKLIQNSNTDVRGRFFYSSWSACPAIHQQIENFRPR